VNYKILVIDHDPDDVERVQGLLQDAGYHVLVAHDTTAGLVTFQREKPSLVLIEILMPGQRGTEFCRNLKHSASGRDCPVVLFSGAGEDDQETLLQVAQSGCDQVIQKPITGDKLIEVCRQLLSSDDSPKNEGWLGDVQSALGQLDQMGETDAPLMNTAEASIDRPEAEERPTVEAVTTETAEAKSSGEREDLSFVYEEGSANTEQASVNPKQQQSQAAPPSKAPAPSTHSDDSGDQGEDIEAHLESLFGEAPPVSAPPPSASPVPPKASEKPAPQAKKPDDPDIFKRAHKMVFPEGKPTDPREDAPPATPESNTDLTLELEDVKAPTPAAPKAPVAVPPPAVTASQTEAFGQTTVEPAQRVAAAIEQPTDTRSKRILWVIAAAVAVIIIGTGYFVFFSGSSDEPTERIADASRSSNSTAPAPPPVRLPASGVESSGANRIESNPTAADPATEIPSEPTRATTTPVERTASKPTAVKPASPTPRETSSPRAVETAPPPKPRPTVTQQQRSSSPPPATAQPSSTKRVTSEPSAPAATAGSGTASTPQVKSDDRLAEPAPVEPTTKGAGDEATSSAEVIAATPQQTPAPRETVTPPPEPAPSVASSTPAPELTSANPPATAAPPAFTEPIAISRVEPSYPAKALKKGERGTVLLKVLVSEQGSIVRVLVEQGIPGSELEAAAISAVLRWKYQPATENGEPVKAWAKARFVFEN
jgi:protein TonB